MPDRAPAARGPGARPVLGRHGNQARQEALRSRKSGPGGDPTATFSESTRGAGQRIPYQAEMEAAFGRDFSGVTAYLGQRAPMASLGAEAATRGPEVAFASTTPDRRLVAHELAHVVQQERAGAGLQPKASTSTPGDASEREADRVAEAVVRTGEAPEVRAAPTGTISGGWLDAVINALGDLFDLREDEERLDAEEDLARFRARLFAPIDRFESPAGVGQFAVEFDAATGELRITSRVFFEFTEGDPAKVAPGFRPEEFRWNGEEAQWKAAYMAALSSAWSSPATGITFRSTRPYWDSMVVGVRVNAVEVASRSDAHFIVQVARYPSDAAMTGSSVCPPETHHANGVCLPNTAAGTPARYENLEASTVRLDSNDLRPEQKLDWGNAVTQVHFQKGSSTLDAAGRRELQPVIRQMQAEPASHAQLTGHASSDHPPGVDATEGAEQNMDLARARTVTVQAALNDGGIQNDRLFVRNAGEQGASEDPSWCRVDVQVGTRPTQTPAVHEGGHMLGNGDEYASAGPTPDYDAMVLDQTGQVLVHDDNANVMSLGNAVRPWNYAAFLAALKQVTGMQEWSA